MTRTPHTEEPRGSDPESFAVTAHLILAALTPTPNGATMPTDPSPRLRPGPPVDMSPEAVEARQAAAVRLLADRNRDWLRKRADGRGELPIGDDDP